MATQNGYQTKWMENVKFPEMQAMKTMLQPIMKASAQPTE